MNRTIRYGLIVALLLAGGCLTGGCKSATAQEVESIRQQVEIITDAADKTGTAYVAEFEIGNPYAYAEQRFGLSFVTAKVTLFGNGASGRLPREFTDNAASGRPVEAGP